MSSGFVVKAKKGEIRLTSENDILALFKKGDVQAGDFVWLGEEQKWIVVSQLPGFLKFFQKPKAAFEKPMIHVYLNAPGQPFMQRGPFTISQARKHITSGKISADTWIFVEGDKEWRQLRDVQVLSQSLPKLPASPPANLATAETATTESVDEAAASAARNAENANDLLAAAIQNDTRSAANDGDEGSDTSLPTQELPLKNADPVPEFAAPEAEEEEEEEPSNPTYEINDVQSISSAPFTPPAAPTAPEIPEVPEATAPFAQPQDFADAHEEKSEPSILLDTSSAINEHDVAMAPMAPTSAPETPPAAPPKPDVPPKVPPTTPPGAPAAIDAPANEPEEEREEVTMAISALGLSSLENDGPPPPPIVAGGSEEEEENMIQTGSEFNADAVSAVVGMNFVDDNDGLELNLEETPPIENEQNNQGAPNIPPPPKKKS